MSRTLSHLAQSGNSPAQPAIETTLGEGMVPCSSPGTPSPGVEDLGQKIDRTLREGERIEGRVKKVGVIKRKLDGRAPSSSCFLLLARLPRSPAAAAGQARVPESSVAGSCRHPRPHHRRPGSVSRVSGLNCSASPRVPSAPGRPRPYRASLARHSGQRGVPFSASASASSLPVP